MQSIKDRVLTLLFFASSPQGLVLQLFRDNPVSTFRSIDDVKNCRIDATDFCIPRSGATEDFWKFIIAPSRNNCRTTPLEKDQPFYIESEKPFEDPYSQALSAVAEKKCKFLMAQLNTMTVATETTYCNVLRVVGDSFFPVPISVVLPKDSNLTEPISVATMKFQQSDRLPSPIKYGAPRKCDAVSANNLTWDRLSEFFIVVWTALFVMLVFMVIDRRPSNESEDGDPAVISNGNFSESGDPEEDEGGDAESSLCNATTAETV